MDAATNLRDGRIAGRLPRMRQETREILPYPHLNQVWQRKATVERWPKNFLPLHHWARGHRGRNSVQFDTRRGRHSVGGIGKERSASPLSSPALALLCRVSICQLDRHLFPISLYTINQAGVILCLFYITQVTSNVVTPRGQTMLAAPRGVQSVIYRPLQLASAFSNCLLPRHFSSPGCRLAEEQPSQPSRKLRVSERTDYYKSYYEKNKEALLHRQKEYRARHPGSREEYMRNYYQNNKDRLKSHYTDKPEARKAARDRFYQKHREAILARQRQYRADNADTFKERKRKWDQENRDAIREYQRQYRALNPERLQIANARYYQKHKEAILTRQSQYRAEKENARSEEEKAERAEAKAERFKHLAEKAEHKRLLDENKKRLAEEEAMIDRERVARLTKKTESISDRVKSLRQIARQKRLEGSRSKDGP